MDRRSTSPRETQAANLYLSGNFAPVQDERSDFELPVTGQIPRELEGRLLRIGPNPVAPDPVRYDWFIGNGMVHGVSLRGGRAEWYRRRYVRDDEVVAAKGWPPVPGPRRRDVRWGGMANTNVIGHAGRLYAIIEAGNLPVELDVELDTIGRSDFDGTLPGGFSAHPKRDPVSGELWAAVYSPFFNAIQVVVVGADGRVRRTVDVPVRGRPLVHDCAITERYFVLLDLPVVFTPERLAEIGVPYRWKPEYGARVGLLPREGDAADVIWNDVEPCYVFHSMNAYDGPDGSVVLDVVRHPKMFAMDVDGGNEGAPLERWIIDPKGSPVREQRLDAHIQEFPRHDERRVGRPYRFGYAVILDRGLSFGALLKHDLRTGKTELHDEGSARSFMEPVFVPTRPDSAEDDGYVLAYLHDATTDRSDVVILHAQDFTGEPLATIHLPTRVPYGFHGNWVPDAAA